MNERVTLTGTAYNGKEGALIRTPDGTPYYIENLNAWDSTYLNKVIEATGILTVIKLSKDDLRNKKGEYVAGISGDKRVLSEVRYKVIEPRQ